MIAYIFYCLLFHFVKLVTRIVIFLAPTPLIETIVTNQFKSFGIRVALDLNHDGVKPRSPTDRADKYKCEMVVYDRRFFKAFAVDGMMAHGTAYMNGWFESSDLALQIQCIIEHGSRGGNLATRFFVFLWMLKEQLDTAANKQKRGSQVMEVMDVHYNLGNDLYEAMLGDPMVYTCAFFPDGQDEDDLTKAQIAKMELVAQKLKLEPGMKVLDLGCGFGSIAKYLAEKYSVEVVGYNISKAQLDYGRELCKDLPVTLIEDDYRNATGDFDRVYSVGIFEHIGRHNFREYFEVVDRCLKDDGLHLVHSITLRDSTLPRTDEWLNKFIFPGGELPYPQDYVTFAEGLFTVEDMHNFGASYAKTLRAWRKRFIAAWPALEAKYGHMVDGKFYKMWINYLSGCMASFDCRCCNLYQVVYTKQGIKDVYGGYDSVR